MKSEDRYGIPLGAVPMAPMMNYDPKWNEYDIMSFGNSVRARGTRFEDVPMIPNFDTAKSVWEDTGHWPSRG